MTTVERVKKIAAARKIPISKIEKDLGYGNGYFASLKGNTMKADRLSAIAEYLNVDLGLLLGAKDAYGLMFEDWAEIGKLFYGFCFANDKSEYMLSNATGIQEEKIKWFYNGGYPLRASDVLCLSAALNVPLNRIVGKQYAAALEAAVSPSNVEHIAYMAPVLGRIPAGYPVYAVEDELGRDPVPEGIPHPEECFYLEVSGDSMIGAGIYPGDRVLIRHQSDAENGQIVACRVNGDEATLKRFHKQGDQVMLTPENAAYSPIIVPASQFETGDAAILGVAITVTHRL